ARPPILRRYLACAPGARAHVAVDRHAPLDEFARVAPQVPVFRIVAEKRADGAGRRRPAGLARSATCSSASTADLACPGTVGCDCYRHAAGWGRGGGQASARGGGG